MYLHSPTATAVYLTCLVRNLSARFAAVAEDEDADTFLPDGGTVSFANPWYNQSNGSHSEGNENGSKKEYHKLTPS